MELIAGILIAVAFGTICSGDLDELRDFLVAFSVAVALIALSYIGISILAS
mgnify:CR=1 FL=1|jgi:hypothetical protein